MTRSPREEVRAALVVNAGARSGEELFERAREALVRAGVVLSAAHRVEDGDALRRAIRRELRRGASRIVVGGGDGTLSATAGLLAGSDATLGVLPLGTANDFARALRIPADLRRACRVAAGGAVRTVDVAFAGRRAFLNAASAGVSSAATRALSPALKRHAGPLAYPIAGAAAAGAPPFHARLVVDGELRHDGPALQVVVGNGRFHGGGRLVAPGARPDDGALDVYVLAAPSEEEAPGTRMRHLAALARYALLLVRGRHIDHPDVLHLRARQVALRTRPRLEIDADGELVGHTPATFRVSPAALRVLAPALPARRRAARAAARRRR